MKVAILLFVYLGFVRVWAGGLTCQNLFLITDTEIILQSAESLARFRAEILAVTDSRKKEFLLQEFDIKFADFLQSTENPEEAAKIFAQTFENALGKKKKSTRQEQWTEQLKVETIKADEDHLNQWKQAREIPLFSPGNVMQVQLTSSYLVSIEYKQKFNDARLKIFDIRTMKPVSFPADPDNNYSSFSLSKDGSTLLALGPHLNTLIDLKTMTEIPLPSFNSWVFDSSALSEDGTKMILSKRNGHAFFYDRISQKSTLLVGDDGPARQLYLSPDGSKIIQTVGRYIALSDLSNPGEISEIWSDDIKNPKSIEFSTDGQSVLINEENKAVSLLDLKTLRRGPVPLTLVRPPFSESRLRSISKGSYVITMGSDGAISIFNLKTNKERILKNTPFNLGSPIVTADGRLILFSKEGHRVFSLANGKRIETPFSGARPFVTATISPDQSKILFVDYQGRVLIWYRDISEARKFDESTGAP